MTDPERESFGAMVARAADLQKGRVVLVCGGRGYARWNISERAHLIETLNALAPRAVVHGGAQGADDAAGLWAQSRGIPEIVVPAQWEALGKAAGHARNGWMLEFTKADLVVAFPGGAGTANMVKQARERGVEVLEVACAKQNGEDGEK